MNEEELHRQNLKTAREIQRLAPAALQACDNALARLNKPWYVRAWHQLLGHEGWGSGEEIFFLIVLTVAFGLLALIAWMRL